MARADAAVAVGEALVALGEADAALEVLARALPALPDGPGRGRALAARSGALAILGRDPLPDLAAAADVFTRCGHRAGLLGVLRRTAEAHRRAAEVATPPPAGTRTGSTRTGGVRAGRTWSSGARTGGTRARWTCADRA
ncbi:MAG: hypothetical protein AB7J32_01555 [Pseudonocardia sp.]